MTSSGILGPTKALNALQLDDGRPNNQARREALDEVVAHALSNDEIRYLRTKLNAITMKTDICANLPAEILIQVAEYFELEDIMKARYISRSWREKFSSSEMSLRMTQKYFRTQWERSDVLDSVTEEGLAKWFTQATAKWVKRQHGYYHSMSAYRCCQKFLIPHLARAEYEYHSGRVACKLSKDSIVVNTLNQGPLAQPRIYMDDNRMTLEVWHLSDEFLVAQRSRPLTLLAWSLGNEALHTIRLPSPIIYISAHRDQVVLTTVSRELLIWTIGGSLISAYIPEEQKVLQRDWVPIAIVFHPLNERHFFVFYQTKRIPKGNSSGQKSGLLIVQEFIGGRIFAAHHVDYEYDIRLSSQNSSYDRGPVWTDNNDGFWILRWGPKALNDSPSNLLLSFNTYTSKFGTVPLTVANIPSNIMKSIHNISGRQLHAELEEQESYPPNSRPRVFIDDDFLVVTMGPLGYVVWCFDKDIELPVSDSLSNESLQAPPVERHRPLE